MTTTRIRPAETGDIPEIVRLTTSLFCEDAGQRDPFTNLDWPEEHGDNHFNHRITDERSHCLVAENDDQVVGYLAGQLNEQTPLRPVDAAEIESMYVEVTHRNRGVGTELCVEFLDWAGKQGATRATVSAYVAYERAIGFYKRLGFEQHRIALERGIE